MSKPIPPASGGNRRGDRIAPVVILLMVAVVVVGLAGGRLLAGSTNARSSGDAAEPSHPSAPPPWPSASSETSYAAVFKGDSTGATDVTAALKAFLESHDGERVALAVDGRYAIRQLTFTAKDLTVDFRGSRLQGTLQGANGIFLIRSSSHIVINDPYVVGTGYAWVGGESNPDQFEHGIEIDSGSDIVINNPITRDTRGDGIYVGFDSGKNAPATGIVINDPNIEYASRNGISPVAGAVSIFGGHINHVGLHGVDFEPNYDEGARSIIGVVDGVDIRHVQDLDVAGLTGFAVAAGGQISAPRPSITVERVTGDTLRMLLPYTAVVIVRDNVSDVEAKVDFDGSVSVTFTNNVRLTRK